MNSFWNNAANEVGEVLGRMAEHPFGVACGFGAVAISIVGVTVIIKERKAANRRSKDIAERFNRVPEPPEFSYPANSSKPESRL